MALTDILDPTRGSTPLLLDDCFAHTDRYRLVRALALLAEQAQHRQVILFTDEAVVEQAMETVPGAELIELPDPVGIASSAGSIPARDLRATVQLSE